MLKSRTALSNYDTFTVSALPFSERWVSPSPRCHHPPAPWWPPWRKTKPGASLLVTGTFTFNTGSKPLSLLTLPTNTQLWRGLIQHCHSLQDVCMFAFQCSLPDAGGCQTRDHQHSPATAPLSGQDGASSDFRLMRRNKIMVGFRSFL